MTTQICIDAKAGQDCLSFSRIGAAPTTNWQFEGMTSTTKTRQLSETPLDNPLDSVNQGLFYVGQSAYGHMV